MTWIQSKINLIFVTSCEVIQVNIILNSSIFNPKWFWKSRSLVLSSQFLAQWVRYSFTYCFSLFRFGLDYLVLFDASIKRHRCEKFCYHFLSIYQRSYTIHVFISLPIPYISCDAVAHVAAMPNESIHYVKWTERHFANSIS